MNKLDREPTKTLIVEQALQAADDFCNVAQLATALVGKVNVNQLTAALTHLKKYGAVGVIEVENVLWFYSTPDTDTRSKRVEERVVEEPGNRQRGKIRQVLPRPKLPGKRVRFQQEAEEANEIARKLRQSKS